MGEKLKEYCEYELENVEKRGYNPHEAVTRCYGALMFILNYAGNAFDDELGNWWDDEMLPRFREFEMKGAH